MKYRLDLSEYNVEFNQPVTRIDEVTGKEIREFVSVNDMYPLRENINTWLRSVGIFKSGEDIAEAILLAKTISNCKEDELILDDREADVLKKAINRHVALTYEGKSNLGGPLHEEAIYRVMKMQEVK